MDTSRDRPSLTAKAFLEIRIMWSVSRSDSTTGNKRACDSAPMGLESTCVAVLIVTQASPVTVAVPRFVIRSVAPKQCDIGHLQWH